MQKKKERNEGATSSSLPLPSCNGKKNYKEGERKKEKSTNLLPSIKFSNYQKGCGE